MTKVELMDKKSRKMEIRKLSGWALFAFGMLWAVVSLMTNQSHGIHISKTLGEVTLPILLSLVGLYFAGVIKGIR